MWFEALQDTLIRSDLIKIIKFYGNMILENSEYRRKIKEIICSQWKNNNYTYMQVEIYIYFSSSKVISADVTVSVHLICFILFE